MRAALTVLVLTSILLTLWFVLRLGYPGRSLDPAMAWLWSLTGWVTVALDVLLLLILLRVAFSPWIALGVLAAQDGVYAWRLQVLYVARRADPPGEGSK